MAKYRLELLLNTESRTKDKAFLKLRGETIDIVKVMFAYLGLKKTWSCSYRNMLLPEIKIYKNGHEIDEGELITDMNLDSLREGRITLKKIKRKIGKKEYNRYKAMYNPEEAAVVRNVWSKR
jgi:hypothetical protein